MSRFKSGTDKKYLKIVNDLRKSKEDVHDIYAETTFRENFARIQKQYGKAKNKCFCKLFRDQCVKNNGTCDFSGNGIGSWRDHGQMYEKENQYTFISEPYTISHTAFQNIYHLCKEYNLKVEIDARESSWFPSRTTAIIIRKA